MAMRFQEVANKAGLTAHTIRFYEKEGVLDSRHVRREPNNYRNYSDEEFECLQLIKKFQGVACSLAELKDILQDHDAHARTNQQVIEWIRQKIREIEGGRRNETRCLGRCTGCWTTRWHWWMTHQR